MKHFVVTVGWNHRKWGPQRQTLAISYDSGSQVREEDVQEYLDTCTEDE